MKTHVVGPMCHVLWRWTTGDAVGANMMTRNSYLLNMGYVVERAPVPIERSLLEEHGGDKKPCSSSSRAATARRDRGVHVDGGCGATGPADDDRRPARARLVGTHGAVASGMQSVAFTPASAIAAIFTATGQDIGMVGTSSMAHGVGRRVADGLNVSIRLPGLEVATVGGGTTLPFARPGCA